MVMNQHPLSLGGEEKWLILMNTALPPKTTSSSPQPPSPLLSPLPLCCWDVNHQSPPDPRKGQFGRPGQVRAGWRRVHLRREIC